MSKQIAVRIADDELASLDEAVASGSYPNRAVAVRAALAQLLRDERDRRIGEQYRRAYEQ